MLTTGERATAHRLAVTIDERGDLDNDALQRLLAAALLEAEERERGYQERIRELQDAVERTAASGVENAKRYAADLAAERRAGADRVERIRAALLAGATDEEQRSVAADAFDTIDDRARHSCGAMRVSHAAAYLAQGQALAEARALLSEIGERARALLGKAPA